MTDTFMRTAAVTALGPIYQTELPLLAVPAPLAVAALHELALEANGRPPLLDNLLFEYHGPEHARLVHSMVQGTICAWLMQQPLTGQLRFAAELMATTRLIGSTEGLEGLLATTVNALWFRVGERVLRPLIGLLARSSPNQYVRNGSAVAFSTVGSASALKPLNLELGDEWKRRIKRATARATNPFNRDAIQAVIGGFDGDRDAFGPAYSGHLDEALDGLFGGDGGGLEYGGEGDPFEPWHRPDDEKAFWERAELDPWNDRDARPPGMDDPYSSGGGVTSPYERDGWNQPGFTTNRERVSSETTDRADIVHNLAGQATWFGGAMIAIGQTGGIVPLTWVGWGVQGIAAVVNWQANMAVAAEKNLDQEARDDARKRAMEEEIKKAQEAGKKDEEQKKADEKKAQEEAKKKEEEEKKKKEEEEKKKGGKKRPNPEHEEVGQAPAWLIPVKIVNVGGRGGANLPGGLPPDGWVQDRGSGAHLDGSVVPIDPLFDPQRTDLVGVGEPPFGSGGVPLADSRAMSPVIICWLGSGLATRTQQVGSGKTTIEPMT